LVPSAIAKIIFLGGRGESFVSVNPLGIFCAGRSLEKSIAAAHEEFDTIWIELVEANEEELHKSAKQLKRLVESLVVDYEQAE